MAKPEKHVFICTQQRPFGHPRGSCAANHDAFSVFNAFSTEIDQRGLFKNIQITSTGCMGPCDKGPTILVYPEGIMYSGVKPADVPTILEQHLLGDEPVTSLLMPPQYWS